MKLNDNTVNLNFRHGPLYWEVEVDDSLILIIYFK